MTQAAACGTITLWSSRLSFRRSFLTGVWSSSGEPGDLFRSGEVRHLVWLIPSLKPVRFWSLPPTCRVDWIGKGPGYVVLGAYALTLGFLVALIRPDALIGFSAIIAASVAFVSAGGAAKAVAEARNGHSNGATKPPSG